MITIRQTQRKIKFCSQDYKIKAEKILSALHYTDFDLGIWLTTNQTIQMYNRDHRKQDKPTDVLSFPYHTSLIAGKKINVHSDDDKNLGDLIISVEYVYANKQKLPGNFIERMDRMLVHGICHLLGYDHIQDHDYKKMITLEKKLLKIIQST